MVIAATAAVLAIATDGASAQTETHTRHVKSGTHGQHVAVAKHPPTRVIVTRRSYLDAGTEVLPGDRKFTDYAYPQARSFGEWNNNRPLDRQPLNPPSDLGGYPQTFPLY